MGGALQGVFWLGNDVEATGESKMKRNNFVEISDAWWSK